MGMLVYLLMKIYIYTSISGAAKAVYRESVEAHRLWQHMEYLKRLERYFNRYRTDDPDEADYFFIPLLLIAFQFHKTFSDPWPLISKLPYLSRGRGHILFASGDFGQRAKSPYESHAAGRAYPDIYQWLDDRFLLLAFESTTYLASQDIGILPYPLERNPWFGGYRPPVVVRQAASRDLLYSFSGAMAYPQLPIDHIRGGKLIELGIESSTAFVGSSEAAVKRYGKQRGSDVGMLRRSKFTLCPAGFGRWTFRLSQCPVYGSIPVLLSDGYVKPFADVIKWDNFCLTVPETDYLEVPELLKSFSPEAISNFETELRNHVQFFTESGVHELIAAALQKRIL